MDDTTADLRDLAEAWADAIVSNDVHRIAEFMAADWVIVSDTGVTTRADFLGVVASGDLTHSAMTRISEPRIRIYGDTAVYTARVTNTAHYRGERFDADEWTTDVFVRDGGRWRCVHSHITAADREDLVDRLSMDDDIDFEPGPMHLGLRAPDL